MWNQKYFFKEVTFEPDLEGIQPNVTKVIPGIGNSMAKI